MADPKYASQIQFEQIDQNGGPLFPTSPAYTTGASDQVVKAAPGRLFKVIVTVAGTASSQFFDNATAGSGNLVFQTAAAPALGTIYDFGMYGLPFANGLTYKGAASTSNCTVAYA